MDHPSQTGPSPELVGTVEEILSRFRDETEAIDDLEGLEEVRARYLGRSRGRLTALFDRLGDLPPDERKAVGRAANEARQAISEELDRLEERLRAESEARRVSAEAVDVSLPGRPPTLGGLHPVTLTLREIEAVFQSMGYRIVEGPEVEHDWYNFEALNMPREHPARDTQDTLYLDDDWLLRTHTSPVQIRFMESHTPPLAIVVPGRVFRRDTPDATHTPMFVQCEGLVVDEEITMADLKGSLERFAKALFGPSTSVRFRPGYFPFTEPSAEVDATCPACGGDGCSVCKGSGWVEMLGCGMVHPNVFRAVDYDPEEVQGFAFGMGVDRIASVRYGFDDIRALYENDVRFLEQFAE